MKPEEVLNEVEVVLEENIKVLKELTGFIDED